jgi:aminomethyltransferase
MQKKSAPLKRTALLQAHLSLGAQMVPFAGWEMPIQYSSILAEARAVRSAAGIFDVSHMGRVEITGSEAARFIHNLVTANILNMPLGRARYTLRVLTQETALIALQGPRAGEILQPVCSVDLSALRPFRCEEGQVSEVPGVLCRTGYTGEDGYELIVPAEDASSIWLDFKERGATPCGLGARDVLRLEAGLLLHGSDMDSTVTPMEAGLERFVNWDQGDFIGLSALQESKSRGLSRNLVGFRLVEKGVPRHGHTILSGEKPIGSVTSGTYSPTLDMGIGLGYVALEFSNLGTRIALDIRGRRVEAEVVTIPFYSRNR